MNVKNNVVIAVSVVCIFVFALASITVLAIAAPDSTAIGLIIATIPPTIASIAVLQQQGKTDDKVTKLTNGVMDAKIRAGVADVVHDSMIDPLINPQLQIDRAGRDNH